MAKLNDETMKQAFQPYLEPGERVTHVAFGVKQPPILLIVVLMLFGVLPGVIAVLLMTKNYVIGLTGRRFLVLQVASMTNAKAKATLAYVVSEVRGKARTSTGALFTHIAIDDAAQPFVAKFHRAYSKTNRESAMAIAQAISG